MRRKGLLMLFLLLLGVIPVSAQVILPPPCSARDCIPVPPPIGTLTNPEGLKIDYHRVNVTIQDQVSTTEVNLQFTNQGVTLAEGTFIFPLPRGAAVSELNMWVDDQPIEARILPAGEARAIYDEIVRQYRDPALLEYIGQDLIQANIFPIAAEESRRVTFTYTQVLSADNGMIHYTYPLHHGEDRIIGEMSLHLTVTGQDEISNIYSPNSYRFHITRDEDQRGFSASFEQTDFRADGDFSLYYGESNNRISLNLMTYRESADEDGFFMLLVQPPVSIPAEQIIPKDIIIVLDQSGSMHGSKWTQAKEATRYVLENLNDNDRFNLILFSSDWRLYSQTMQESNAAADALTWVNSQDAAGNTNINGALLSALELVEDRQAVILFLTDGLATQGETATPRILENLRDAKPETPVRIFTFGVGYDVDTFLLDAIVRDHRGTGAYVRPNEDITEHVTSLYNKITAPVLNEITLDMAGLEVDWLYPAQLPDLFAGEQLMVIGRYRNGAENIPLTLNGQVADERQNYIYEGLNFPVNAGGDPFIAKLWATRRIADLLNTIRLDGENKELVESVVSLSLRYGIITPYTSFLIEEDDILSQQGRDRALEGFSAEAEVLARDYTGSSAVDTASAIANLADSSAPASGVYSSPRPNGDEAAQTSNPIRSVGVKTFILQDEIWMDTTYTPGEVETQPVVFLSDEYFALLSAQPDLSAYFALGERVIVLYEGIAYEVTAE
jgi:Ca-activated chloride channel family protein